MTRRSFLSTSLATGISLTNLVFSNKTYSQEFIELNNSKTIFEQKREELINKYFSERNSNPEYELGELRGGAKMGSKN